MKSDFTTGRAVGMLECGKSFSHVARKLGVSREIVVRWWTQFLQLETVVKRTHLEGPQEVDAAIVSGGIVVKSSTSLRHVRYRSKSVQLTTKMHLHHLPHSNTNMRLSSLSLSCPGAAAAGEGEAKAGDRRERIGRKSQAAAAVGGGGELTGSPFFVWNRCDDFYNGNNFSAVLRLPGRPTVGHVRRAIAHRMRRPTAGTELRRTVGRTKSGEEVFGVGKYSLVFADVSGGEKGWSEVEDWDDEILHDDNRPFPVVAGHKNLIIVRPR